MYSAEAPQERNPSVEALKKYGKRKVLKNIGKKVIKAAINAITYLFKMLLSLLLSVGLPYILILIGIVLTLLTIYMAITLVFSIDGGTVGFGTDAEEFQKKIIEIADSTVDMDRPEQLQYRVPHELIIAAIQIYNSEDHGKSELEAAKIMADALAPKFEYEKYDTKIEIETKTCVTNPKTGTSCNTTKTEEHGEINPLVRVEAWDRIVTFDYQPFTTDWVTTTSQTTRDVKMKEKDPETGKMVEVTVQEVVNKTIKSRAHTYVSTKNEQIDYTHFDTALSNAPFEYGQDDKYTVEALYQATGGKISYKEWKTSAGGLVGGFKGLLGNYYGIGFPGSSIPSEFVPIYLAAEQAYHVPWYILAAIHYVETGFSTHPTMVSSVGAEGHVQFMPCSWLGWGYSACKGTNGGVSIPDSIKYNPKMIKKYGGFGIDANNNGIASPWEVEDAIFAAANLLTKNGVQNNVAKAIYNYNHSQAYVNKVLSYAEKFKQEGQGGTRSIVAQVGMKWIKNSVYVFGGGRNEYDIQRGRFDCSSFVHWAFKQAGVNLGNLGTVSTNTLKVLGNKIPLSDAQPGDIIFFDTYKKDGHVGIWLGNGKWIGCQSSTGVAIVDLNSNSYWKSHFSGHVRRILP